MSTSKTVSNATSIRHQHTTLQLVRANELLLVKANRDAKSPSKSWQPTNWDWHRTCEVIKEIEGNEDYNYGVVLCDDIVDVDVDTDDPNTRDALPYFLPGCSHTWGRQSNPASHHLYKVRDPDNVPAARRFMSALQKVPAAKVEIRGGEKAQGLYSLLPGSMHPDGELYEWTSPNKAQSSISVTDTHTLLKAIRKSAAIGLLAPHWLDGRRNDLIQALSGFLYRAWKVYEGMDVNDQIGMFAMDVDEAWAFAQILMKIAGDEDLEESHRKQSFYSTWSKGDKGTKITGATRIQEIAEDTKIRPLLYKLLTDGENTSKIEEFLDRFAIWQGPGIVIDLSVASRGDPKCFMNRTAFNNSWGHERVVIDNKSKPLADLMFHMQSTTRVAGLEFAPPGSALFEAVPEDEDRNFVTKYGQILINQWAGFAVPEYKDKVTNKDVKPFLDYLWECVSSKDQEIYDWVVNWLACLFREPGRKPGTALALVGKPGAGKSILGHSILIPMIGRYHAISTNSIETLTANFNISSDNKILVQCDEATNNRQRATAAKLKALITDPEQKIEPKGVDPYFKSNHIRLLFTSNDIEDALFLTDGAHDRRYTVVEVSDARCGDLDYWAEFAQWLRVEDKDRNPVNLMRIRKWLESTWKYDRRMIERPLLTDAKSRMQERSWDAFDAWLHRWVSEGHPLSRDIHKKWWMALPEGTTEQLPGPDRDSWPEYVDMAAMADDYNRFAKGFNRTSDKLNAIQLGQMMKKRGMKPEKSSIRIRVEEYDEREEQTYVHRIRLYPIPHLDYVKRYLRDKFGDYTGDSQDEAFEDKDLKADATGSDYDPKRDEF